MNHKVICATAAVLLCASVGHCKQKSDQRAKSEAWLKQFGYLPPSDQPYSGEEMEAAIRRMQKFAGLPETGKLDAPTVARMSKPRCSRPDVEPHSRRIRRYALSGYYWNKTELTWSLENYPSQIVSPFLNCNLVPRILTFAMKAWTDVTPLHIKKKKSGGKTGDIQVSFDSGDHGDGYPFDGKSGVLAHAFYPGNYELAGDVHFDNAESWSYGRLACQTQDFDLFSTAVHEFGHSLGLAHSSTQTAIMYPYYQGPVLNFRKYKLPEDDRKGIQAIYGKKLPPHFKASRVGTLAKVNSKDLNEVRTSSIGIISNETGLEGSFYQINLPLVEDFNEERTHGRKAGKKSFK